MCSSFLRDSRSLLRGQVRQDRVDHLQQMGTKIGDNILEHDAKSEWKSAKQLMAFGGVDGILMVDDIGQGGDGLGLSWR